MQLIRKLFGLVWWTFFVYLIVQVGLEKFSSESYLLSISSFIFAPMTYVLYPVVTTANKIVWYASIPCLILWKTWKVPHGVWHAHIFLLIGNAKSYWALFIIGTYLVFLWNTKSILMMLCLLCFSLLSLFKWLRFLLFMAVCVIAIYHWWCGIEQPSITVPTTIFFSLHILQLVLVYVNPASKKMYAQIDSALDKWLDDSKHA